MIIHLPTIHLLSQYPVCSSPAPQNPPDLFVRLSKMRVSHAGQTGPRNMAVVDVIRDRERGMPRYNQARRQYGMPAAAAFSDITDNAEVVHARVS